MPHWARTLLSLTLAGCAAAAPPPPPAAPPPLPASAPTPPAALAIPGCPPPDPADPPIPFGSGALVPLCRDLYVDPALTPDERAFVARAYAAGHEDVVRALGAIEGPSPITIACGSDRCRTYFGGVHARSRVLGPETRLPGATYTAGPRGAILMLSSGDRMRAVIAHETVHFETYFRRRGAFVPAWFNEGLAVVLSGEPDCTGHEGARGVDDLRRLERDAAWEEYTNVPESREPTYCQARAEVDAWLRRSGKDGLSELFAKLREGAAFEAAYGPMATQSAGPLATPIVSTAPTLGDPRKPFSVVMWIKPAARAGVLAHVSTTPAGAGWCVPFLGYDGAGRVVSQMPHDDPEGRVSIAVARDPKPRPLGRWTHVAMTWAPGSVNRLYVDGKRVDDAGASRYHAPGAGPPMYIAWGSSNVGGGGCGTGAVVPKAFQGSMTGMRVYDTELSPADVAALARTPP